MHCNAIHLELHPKAQAANSPVVQGTTIHMAFIVVHWFDENLAVVFVNRLGVHLDALKMNLLPQDNIP